MNTKISSNLRGARHGLASGAFVRRLGAVVLMAAAAPQFAHAGSGMEACKLLGAFDPRGRAACEAALTMSGIASQVPTRKAPVTGATGQEGGTQGYNTSQSTRPGPQGQDAGPTAAPYSAGPARNTATARQSQRPGMSDSGPYRPEKFSGLTIWRDLFAKAAHSPDEFAKIHSNMARDANGSQAMANSLVAPRRNDLQKVLTDYDLYKLYYKNPELLLSKQTQCLESRDYSAEETCDCLAGFPGDTLIGPGAGELVLGSNHSMAVKACGVAFANASDPALKARYRAQQARAQVHTTDPAQAMTWANEAVAAGYRRATIVKAEANLWDVEFMAGGFPAMTQAQFELEMKEGLEHLKAAKRAGVAETFLVARKFQQELAHVSFNTAVLTPVLKAMMTDAPPPSGDDQRNYERKRHYDATGCGGTCVVSH